MPEREPAPATVALPPGAPTALTPLLTGRRSIKELTGDVLDLEEVAGLLRHAAGVDGAGHPTYASARSAHLVSVTLVAGAVAGLHPGSYQYQASRHLLRTEALGDQRPALAAATVDAHWVSGAPAVLVLTADIRAADARFAELGPGQGDRFAWLEAGLITQNAYLWAAAVGRGVALIGGLDRAAFAREAGSVLPAGHTVLGLLPVGDPAY